MDEVLDVQTIDLKTERLFELFEVFVIAIYNLLELIIASQELQKKI